ncbi:hypothetical protein ABIQ69_15105 [Agromyces sp. G08B096]|uniref:Uncharacterized protein n=1 Tax=Agromyces sp. G08B096 TaxID=3156399 RepID=A0AAU7W4Y9_9MICO
MESDRWDSDVVRAMQGRSNFSIVFSESQTAASLWDYGEDRLADRALTMTVDELRAIRRIAATYHAASYPLPIEGRRITLNHVVAFAAVAFFEGRLRPLAQTRRRPQKARPERFTPVPPAFEPPESPSLPEPAEP